MLLACDPVERGSVMQTLAATLTQVVLRLSLRATGSDRVAELDHAGGRTGTMFFQQTTQPESLRIIAASTAGSVGARGLELPER